MHRDDIASGSHTRDHGHHHAHGPEGHRHDPGHHHHGHHEHHHHDHDHDHEDWWEDWQSAGPYRLNLTRLRRVALSLFALALVAVLLVRSVVFVDETEYVYVTLFGKPVRLLVEPGLAFKWPFETVRRLDRRLQLLNPPGREMLTQGGARRVFQIGLSRPEAEPGAGQQSERLEVGQNLNVEWFACWRLPTPEFAARMSGVAVGSDQARQAHEAAILRYLRAIGTIEAAEARLEDRIWSLVRAEVGQMKLQQFVSLNPEDVLLDELAQKLVDAVRKSAYEQYGIEVVDVRIKRFNHPTAVRSAIYDMIRTERQAVADRTRAEGRSIAETIRSQADKEVRELLARAERDAAEIRARAEAEAMKVANEAHAEDPTFYEFLVTLETYQKMLNEKAVLVLSSESPLMRLLTTVHELASGATIGSRTERQATAGVGNGEPAGSKPEVPAVAADGQAAAGGDGGKP